MEYILRKFIFVLIIVIALHLAPNCLRAQQPPDLVWQRGAHLHTVRAVGYSPDGKYFASSDGGVKLWRLSDGMLLRTLGAGLSFAFASDSKTLLSTNDRTIQYWSLPGSTLVKTVTGFTGNILSLAISPDLQVFAAGMDDSKIQIRRFSDGVLLGTLSGHTFPVASVAFSPDGQLLASATGQYPFNKDNTIQLWRVATRTLERSIVAPGGSSDYRVAFTPDGQNLFVGLIIGGFAVYRVSDGALIRSVPIISVSDLALSPDGQTVAVLAGPTYFYRLSDGAILRSFGPANPKCLAFSPDGNTLAIGGGEGSDAIGLWGVASGRFQSSLTPINNFSQVGQMVPSPDGQWLATAIYNGPLLMLHASDGTFVREFDPTQRPTAVSFSADGKLVAAPSQGKFYVWRVSDATLLHTFDPHLNTGNPFGVVLSPDGKLLIGATSSQTYIWRLSDDVLVTTLTASSSINAISPDGQLYAQNAGNYLQVWRTSDWTLITGQAISYYISSLAFSSDSQSILMSGISASGEAVEIRDVVNLGLKRSFVTSGVGFPWAAFSPDGQVVAVAEDAHLRLWSVVDGSLLISYDEPAGQPILNVAYSTDGKFLYYSRYDGTVASLLNPYRNVMFPNHGGNTGVVTAKLVTEPNFPLSVGATVKLTAPGQPDIVGTPINLENSFVLDVTLDLRRAPLGKRNIVITLPGGTTRTYSHGFTIEQGISPQVVASIIGRSALRGGRPSGYLLTVSNLVGHLC